MGFAIEDIIQPLLSLQLTMIPILILSLWLKEFSHFLKSCSNLVMANSIRFHFTALSIIISSISFHSTVSAFGGIYSTFSMEQIDNGKPNGFLEYWKLDCMSDKSCDLHQLAFQCGGENKVMTPFLDFYSTRTGRIKNLKVMGVPKKISFSFSQPHGPDDIKCEIEFSPKSAIELSKAECVGNGEWSAGTKYRREFRLIKSGNFSIQDRCKKAVEFP